MEKHKIFINLIILLFFSYLVFANNIIQDENIFKFYSFKILNLSNISYEKGSSLNLGANYAFNNNPINQENNQIDSNQKISSVSISNNKNLLYSHSKTLATIGNGNLIIKDMAKSSELDRLNKDINKLNKELANTKINSSIDASIDTRWFSKEGREELKDDYNKASAITKAISFIIYTENASITEINYKIGEYYEKYEHSKINLAPNLEIINDPKATIKAKEQAATELANTLGVKVKFINTEEYSLGKFNSDEPNIIYISTNALSNAKKLLTSIYHELNHYKDNKNGIYIPNDKLQNEYATNDAHAKLSMAEKALNYKELNFSDYINLNKQATKIYMNNQDVIINTNYFYNLDNKKSDDFLWLLFDPTPMGDSTLDGAYKNNNVEEGNDSLLGSVLKFFTKGKIKPYNVIANNIANNENAILRTNNTAEITKKEIIKISENIENKTNNVLQKTEKVVEVDKKVETPKAYKAPKGGGGVSYETTINGQTYTFGHGGRHAEDVGLNHVKVNEAIANHLSKTKIDWSKIPTNNPYINYINLNGFKFKFIAKKLPNGKINIGTYYRIIDK